MSPNLHTTLRRHFGFDRFRPGQREAITSLMNRQNTLVVMPTGAGKSLCYQLPALLLQGTTLIVSPLIALMKDQVEVMQKSGQAATFINSSLSAAEQSRRIKALRQGEFRLVYVAPERFRSTAFSAALPNVPVQLFAVDEAHCISQWGHDFRPDYLTLRHVIAQLRQPTVAALTATATVKVQEDIRQHLGLDECRRVVTGFNRPNLYFEVEYTADEAAKLRFLQGLLHNTNGSTIIYTGTRREAEEVAEFVTLVCKRETQFYHAGLEAFERDRIQDAFMNDDLRIIVATNAFGMGVDKPDIRCVVHHSIPRSLEAYYQEVGRAGRDGKPSRCILLYSPKDRALQEWFIENDAPTPEEFKWLFHVIKDTADNGLVRIHPGYIQRMTGLHETKIKVGIAELVRAQAVRDLGDDFGCMNFEILPVKKLDIGMNLQEIKARRRQKYDQLNGMIRYAEGNTCRRRTILQHFGDAGEPEAERCCDNCCARASAPTTKAKSPDEYTEAEKAALIILHAVKHLRHEMGRSGLAKILTGSKAKNILQFGWNKTKHYGRLKHLSQPVCTACVDQLLKARYLKLVGADYPVLALTPKGEQALHTLAPIALDVRISPPPVLPNAPLSHLSELPETLRHTLYQFRQGHSVEQIAEKRQLTSVTIYGHFSRLIAHGLVQVTAIIPFDKVRAIRDAIRKVGATSLKPIKELLPDDISYDEIRCVTADEARRQRQAGGERNEVIATDPALLAALQGFRRTLIEAESKPANACLQDSVLRAIATHKPGSLSELSDIEGMDADKIAKYGQQLLDIVTMKAAGDSVSEFLQRSRPKPLRGPWKAGFALDFHSRYAGSDWQRSEIGEQVFQLKYRGATLEEVFGVLSRAGSAAISVLTLTKTIHADI